MVEPVNGFCTPEEYALFMKQVISYERMLQESGVILIKFWLDTSKDEQAKRFEARKKSPLKQWKFSPIDERAQELWEVYTQYRDAMFEKTHTEDCPWVIVQADDKKTARLAAIRYVLNSLDYEGKSDENVRLKPDSKAVKKYKK